MSAPEEPPAHRAEQPAYPHDSDETEPKSKPTFPTWLIVLVIIGLGVGAFLLLHLTGIMSGLHGGGNGGG